MFLSRVGKPSEPDAARRASALAKSLRSAWRPARRGNPRITHHLGSKSRAIAPHLSRCAAEGRSGVTVESETVLNEGRAPSPPPLSRKRERGDRASQSNQRRC